MRRSRKSSRSLQQTGKVYADEADVVLEVFAAAKRFDFSNDFRDEPVERHV